jgi:predicted DCC family thiol-disulfide oxidoreductase YuxK
MQNGPVILFDGVCNLCNGSVQFVIKHDKKNLFSFASLQSESGQKLLEAYSLPKTEFNSFVLIENGKAYTKSNAALMVAKKLHGPVRFLYGLKIVPAFIRNAVYNLIAKNRYKWFGKKDSCMIPTPSLQTRFLK